MLTLLIPPVTYLDFPFPPETNLYPSHEHLQRYHASFATHFNLNSHIHLRHTVTSATWVGDNTSGHWVLRVHRKAPPSVHLLNQIDSFERSFDHLIVASGHFNYPNIPEWEGQDEWLANTPPGTPKREIIHSIYWRDPFKYRERTVVVVGGGSSGTDIVSHVGPVAKKVCSQSSVSMV